MTTAVRALRSLVWASVASVVLAGCSSLGLVGQDDRITGYDVDAVVNPDGTVDMTETITYDFADDPSSGLHREMPTTVRESPLSHRRVEVDGVRVQSTTGAPVGILEETHSHGWYTLRAGDRGAPVTGEQTYVLSYTLDGALTEADGGARLYWNFVGDGWGVPIDDVRVFVAAPAIEDVLCLAGNEEHERTCEEIVAEEDGVLLSEGRLSPEEALTGVVTMPDGAVEVPEAERGPPPVPRWLDWSAAAVLLGCLVACGALLWLHSAWERWRESRRVLPEDPPHDLSPAVAGYVVDGEKLRARHILAALVDLEGRGFLTASRRREDGEWVFLRVPDPPAAPSPSDAVLLEAVFGGRSPREPVDLEALSGALDAAGARRFERELIAQARAMRLFVPRLSYWSRALLGVVGMVGAFLVPGAVNDLTPLDLSPLSRIGLVLLLLVVWALFLPSYRTPYGDRVKERLVRVGEEAEDLAPAWALALDRETVAPSAAEEGRPRFYQDREYRRRWQHTVEESIVDTRSSSGSAASPSGGFSAGGGGGGGGGGRA